MLGMFEIGKILWIALQPANLFLFALGLAWLMLGRLRPRRAGKRLLGFLVLVGLLIAVLPLSSLPLMLLENRFLRPAKLPDKVDGIILLGGGVNPNVSDSRGQPTITAGGPRLLAFAELANKFPDARLVFSGGSGDLLRQDLKEAPVVREALVKLGFKVERVMFEDRSRNTYENAVFSKILAKPQPGETWLLVTSASHMPRATAVFRAQEWQTLPWPVGYWTDGKFLGTVGFDFIGGLAVLQFGLREWIGLAAYRLSGRTEEWFPAP